MAIHLISVREPSQAHLETRKEAPGIAIDLPMKALIWEDASGKVWISYNAPAYLQARHRLRQELVQNYVGTVTDELAAKAAE